MVSARPGGARVVVVVLPFLDGTRNAINQWPLPVRSVTDRAVQQRLSHLGRFAGHVAGAPVALVLLSADDGHLDTAFDLGRVAQTISLAAHAVGRGSCLATIYPDHNLAEACGILGLEPGWLPQHVISVGYPAPSPQPTTAIPAGRLPLTALVTHHETAA